MPASIFITDAATRALVQEGLLERLFRDALFPELLYRKDFTVEPWTDQAQHVVKTRAGLLHPALVKLAPKTDPTPQTYEMEQMDAFIEHYGATIDTDIVVSGLALSDLLIRDVKTLGLQAGQSINRLARNRLFEGALYGQTVTTTTGAGTTKRVPFLNGFTRAFNPNTRKYELVSNTNRLRAYFWNATNSAFDQVEIVGFTPDIEGDECGPGTITLASSYTSTARQPLISSAASYIVRAGGGYSVDAIGPSDVLTLADIRSAVARLRQMNVQPFEDGYYHVHIDPVCESQLLGDPKVIELFRGTKFETDEYGRFILGAAVGCKFYRNNESPNTTTVQTPYGTNGDCFPGELTNASGVPIHRTLVIGQEAGIEYWKDAITVTEAGVTGKIGRWNVTNNGLVVNVDRIQMVMRAPLDRLQRVVSTSWSFFGGHLIMQDHLRPGAAYSEGGFAGSSRYKRLVVIESGE